MGLFVYFLIVWKCMTNYWNKVTVGEEWGKGKGGVLIVSHNHISHELSSEVNPSFEGYSDRERVDYGKIKWHLSFMSEYFWNLLFVNIWKLTIETLVLLCVNSCSHARLQNWHGCI